MPEARAHVVVHGHVQGVFFRDTAQHLALARRLAGWIRNRPDGTVEAVFQGERAAAEALVGWCRRGPSRARVSAVDVVWETPVAGEASFHIR